jgi:DNA repair protein RadD
MIPANVLKPATADTVSGLRDFEQLGGQLDITHTPPPAIVQVREGPTLRPYQYDIINEFDACVASAIRSIIIVAPTGSGKTVIGSEIVRRAIADGKRVLFLAHRREIVKQTAAKLEANGIEHGLIMAGEATSPLDPVQVTAIQTLHARAVRRNKIALPPADLLIADECHYAPARTWMKIVEAYPNAILLGLTATPCRGDGRGLGGIFEKIIECPQVAELITLDHLVRTRTYAPTPPDLKGIKVQAGDYVEKQLAARMDQPKLVGDIISHWHRFAEGRQTVVFATGVRHSAHIRDEFVKSGVTCEHLDGSTAKDERDAILARLKSGETRIVSNCMVLTEGWDMPEVGCCVLARPTKKIGLYRQMLGRVLRPFEGKPDAIIIDHAGACFAHGFAEDPIAWTLDPDRPAKNKTHSKRGEGGSRLVDCSQCGALRTGGEACRHCGFLPAPKPKRIEVIDGHLGLVSNGSAQARVYTSEEMHEWHCQLAYIAEQRSYKSGWIAHKFKEKFNAWPPRVPVVPVPPSYEVASWVKSRMIAYAKARAA